jgi:hypothetical protein
VIVVARETNGASKQTAAAQNERREANRESMRISRAFLGSERCRCQPFVPGVFPPSPAIAGANETLSEL